MPTFTPNYNLPKPNVNSADDEDLWGGQLNDGLDIIDNTMKANADAAAAAGQLPVGSLYFNATDNTNPGTLLGYGTWASFGAGRVLIGVGTGTDANAEDMTFAQGDTGGEYEHTLTEAEMPSHTHDIDDRTGNGSGGSRFGSPNSPTATFPSQATGGDQPHNNLQPYIAVYMWKRTA